MTIARQRRLALAALVLLLSGCQSAQVAVVDRFDLLGHRRSFEATQLEYTQLVRWGEFEAASQYVDPEVRVEFLELARSISELRFTDYHVGAVELEDGLGSGTAEVSYRVFGLRSLIESTIHVTQEWNRDEMGGWRVKPRMESLQQLARGNGF